MGNDVKVDDRRLEYEDKEQEHGVAQVEEEVGREAREDVGELGREGDGEADVGLGLVHVALPERLVLLLAQRGHVSPATLKTVGL